MKQIYSHNSTLRFFGFLSFLVGFPLIWFGGAYFLAQGGFTLFLVCSSKAEIQFVVFVGAVLWLFFVFLSYGAFDGTVSFKEVEDNGDEVIIQEDSVDVLLETKTEEGKIFTFSVNYPKLPSAGEVLVVYSDDEDDYVEFTVAQVSMATNLPSEENYLVKGKVLPSGQEKLEEYGWEEK